MNKFKITCPECGAELVMAYPQTAIWELCPGCRQHVWDGYDAMMAEVVAASSSPEREPALKLTRETYN